MAILMWKMFLHALRIYCSVSIGKCLIELLKNVTLEQQNHFRNVLMSVCHYLNYCQLGNLQAPDTQRILSLYYSYIFSEKNQNLRKRSK